MTEKMNKKSQVTIFVLAGIVILIGVSFLAGLEKEELDEVIEVPVEIKPIKQYLESCTANLVKDALVYISKQGGYYDLDLDKSAVSANTL